MTTSDAFDRGASRYDLMVALNPGYHRELRRSADALVNSIGRRPGLRLIDLACGSGASTRALVEAAPRGTAILGLDASEGMLSEARRKSWPTGVSFRHAVAGALDVDGIGRGAHDGIQACYLFRNIPADQRDRAVAEVHDLLRPGGWLAVQEYSVAGRRSARVVWDAVSMGVIIPLGAVIDQNPSLYRYLRRSVIEFDSLDTFVDRLHRAGFTHIASRTAPGWQRGILHTVVAQKPEES